MKINIEILELLTKNPKNGNKGGGGILWAENYFAKKTFIRFIKELIDSCSLPNLKSSHCTSVT